MSFFYGYGEPIDNISCSDLLWNLSLEKAEEEWSDPFFEDGYITFHFIGEIIVRDGSVYILS